VPRAKRRLGQHFLADPRILARIADALEPGPHDTVLEIGPGRGALTAELVKRSGRVLAIEKDRDLVPLLQERFPSIEIVAADALETDWHALTGGPYLLTGNIPYNITSPLLDKALTPPLPVRIVFLVQKEVADRVTAPPGSSVYGALSVGIQAVASAARVFTVPAGAFQPRPKIDSAVLRLEPLEQPLVVATEREGFRALVVGLFGFRRKQLLRGIRELTGWSGDRVTELLREVGLGETVRPEVLGPGDYVRLYRALVDGGWRTGVTL
jgi:16S rRNA (adenine1518-N6/adenine1519-N6)-dimethyltransferase